MSDSAHQFFDYIKKDRSVGKLLLLFHLLAHEAQRTMAIDNCVCELRI